MIATLEYIQEIKSTKKFLVPHPSLRHCQARLTCFQLTPYRLATAAALEILVENYDV
jgi:hypothetical protein